MTSMKDKLKNSESAYEKLSQDFKEITHKYQSLDKLYSQLNQDHSSLQSDYQNMVQEQQNLDSDHNTLRTQLAKMKSIIAEDKNWEHFLKNEIVTREEAKDEMASDLKSY